MPCGKRPLVKNWDKPKNLKVITPSRYQQNEASVKVHWKNVINDLENSYKDTQFWETQSNLVREIVGPVTFENIAKIFNLPKGGTPYQHLSECSFYVPSENYYIAAVSQSRMKTDYSLSDYNIVEEISNEETGDGAEDEEWTLSSSGESGKKMSRSKSIVRSKSISVSKLMAKSFSKSFTKNLSKAGVSSRSFSGRSSRIKPKSETLDESTKTDDDLFVQMSRRGSRQTTRRKRNPHFEMLYCNESETDMIKWNSNYKKKSIEVSASDEFSKKAEIMTKMICKEFYEWWINLGTGEFKSEIKRAEDIEELFQVWFDEHASRGIILDPRVLPCVLQSISDYVGVPKSACPKVLKKQIDFDIHAETSPAHIEAFGTCLPQKMKHIPPNNNTKDTWDSVKIPEDLKSMACVWDDIQHLTSTKAFKVWLEQRPLLPIPPCLMEDEGGPEKKQLFVVPSDYVQRDRSSTSSTLELNLPVSQFSMELKEVLDKLMNE